MSDVVQINSSHPLIGEWVASDGFSDVVVSITALGNGFSVVVTDESDGEEAETYDVIYDGDRLKFATHWPSNGRFIKYAFLLTDKDLVSVTYTYSAQELWQRSQT